MKLAIFINGFAEVGKDTVVATLTRVMEERRFDVSAVSSIDPIRNMLRKAGYDVDNKTPAMRALMAEVGDACEKFDDTKSKYAANEANAYLTSQFRNSGAVFIHVREAEMITKIEDMLFGDVSVFKLLVTRPGKEAVTSNKADMDVMNTTYHRTLDNNGTLEDLEFKCQDLFDELVEQYGAKVVPINA